MAKRKVDVKAVARELITLTGNKATSQQIVDVIALTGHVINRQSVAALKAWSQA
jgi:hypothetical protein